MLRLPLLLAATAAFLVGCYTDHPDPTVGDRPIVVLTFDSETQKFQLSEQVLTTLHYLRTMQGDAAKVFASASVVADYDAIMAANPENQEDLLKAVVVNGGKPVDFAYVLVNGSIYPSDSHSLNIATSYFNAEQAYLFFQQYKVAPQEPMPIYYFASYSAKPKALVSVTDLGVTDPPLGVLVVPSFTDQSGLPPSMQGGVVAYQYAANIFQQQVFGTEAPLSFLLQKYVNPNTSKGETAESWAPALNLTRGLQAAYADYFAAVILSDPTYVHTTGGAIDEERRLDPEQPRCFSASAAPFNVAREDYDPHTLGSALAAVFWDVDSNRAGTAKDAYRRALVESMKSVGAMIKTKNATFKLSDALSAVASAVSSNDRPRFCSKLLGRFSQAPSDIPACADQQPETSCVGF